MKLTTRSSYLDYQRVLLRLEPFKTHGALSARVVELGDVSFMGRLPDEWRGVVLPDLMREQRVYVVFSYDTPIAWHTRDFGWRVPDESYSKVTSRHQSKIRAALSSAFTLDNVADVLDGAAYRNLVRDHGERS